VLLADHGMEESDPDCKGDFDEALVYAGVLLALAFTINAVLTSVQQRAAAWAQS